ncbi:hypothetical protein GT347_11800 [Xylophilus rhododendri]|uniref:Uncharacterized protein n=1 Tax=Xylophilus rhododendri TaxID=2697032 RepID=A0A857J6H6_9BURK|nr:hypothetical protein [Xylophilus rhododendri]QHI98622.1 hypothetical protein GT347_11800 [Xylophilus rhododendri]
MKDEVHAVLMNALAEAWKKTNIDYLNELVNGEGSLVAALYFNLRNELPRNAGWAVFAECIVRAPLEGVAAAEGKIRIDLVVVHGREIVSAVECKFSPRGVPTGATIAKDLNSLSLLRRRRATSHSVRIEMVRHHSNRGEEQSARKFKMAAKAVRVFALIAWHQAAHTLLTSSRTGLWQRGAPDSGEWEGLNGDRWPPNFAMMVGSAGPAVDDCVATFHGAHFEAAGLATEP